MSNENKSPAPNTTADEPEPLDPNDSDREVDKMKGQTTLHAKPARLEDEGQSGG